MSIISPSKTKWINPSFQEKDTLSRPAFFITHSSYLQYLNVSTDGGFSFGPKIYDKYIPIYNSSIEYNSYLNTIYLTAYNDIVILDIDFNIINSIPIDSFINGNNYFLDVPIQSSGQYLWFNALKIIKGNNGSIKYNIYLIEWNQGKPTNTCIKSPEIYTKQWVILPEFRKAIILEKNVRIMDLSTSQSITTEWSGYDRVDYDNKYGGILSHTSENSRLPIKYFNIETNTEKDLAIGNMAVWGSDGYVYYCVGTTQLWRCKTDGSKEEPVILLTKKPIWPKSDFAVLKTGCDRTFLSWFFCMAHFSRVSEYGIILLDLQSKEIRTLPSESVFSAGMEWIDAKREYSLKVMPKRIENKLNQEFIVALVKGDKRKISEFINQGVNVNASDSTGYTPIIFAVQTGDVDLINILIQNGANLNCKDSLNQNTPLHFVLSTWPFPYIENSNDSEINRIRYEVTNLLIRYGAYINVANKYGMSPLHLSVLIDNIQITNLLLKNKANVNGVDEEGKTALHYAVINNNKEIVKLLLINHADPNIEDIDGNEPIYYSQSEEINKLIQAYIRTKP